MSSTIEPTSFQIKINEEHVVKGIRTLNETFQTINNVTNVDRRVMTIPASSSGAVGLINVNGIDPGPGTFPSSSIKYVRISNLDNATSLAVNFTSSDNGSGASYWSMECSPTSSLIFSSPNVTGSAFDGTFGQDIEFITVYSLSSSIDVEYVVVNA